MNLFIEINYLLFSIENEKMLHSEKMEKLQDLINKHDKNTFENGVIKGMLDSKKSIEEALSKHIENCNK